MGIRPEHVELSTTTGEWAATVRVAEHLGSDTFLYIEGDETGPLTVRLSGEASLRSGDQVFTTPQESKIQLFGADGRAIRS